MDHEMCQVSLQYAYREELSKFKPVEVILSINSLDYS